MFKEFVINTEHEEIYNITCKVNEVLKESGVQEGIVVVFCPHTTAGITINENADDTVLVDLVLGMNKAFPDRMEFLHGEGNSSAHLKASNIGASETIIITNGRLVLGQWQGIFFCEFDGPRKRKFSVKVVAC